MGTPKEQMMDYFKQQMELGRSLDFVPLGKKQDKHAIQEFLDTVQDFIDQGCPVKIPPKELIMDLMAFGNMDDFAELKNLYGAEISLWQYLKDNPGCNHDDAFMHSTENPYIFD